jgi:hypothetical protein
MRLSVVVLPLLAACASTDGEAMPWLNASERACLTQVRTATVLKPGQSLWLYVSRDHRFSGVVKEGAFDRYSLSPDAYNACLEEAAEAKARAGLSEVAPGVFLSPEDKALWDTMTPEQRKRGLAFIATGSTLASSLGEN